MGVEDLSEGYPKTRTVLGDVTNQVGKREISAVLGDFKGHKSDDVSCGILKVDNGSVTDKVKRLRSCSEINSLKGNIVSGISSIPCKNKEPYMLDLTVGNTVTHGTTPQANEDSSSADAVSRLTSVTNLSSEGFDVICDSDEGRLCSRGSKEDDTVGQDRGDGKGADNFFSSQTGSVDCMILPESQESICFELEKCTGLKGNAGSCSIDDPFIASCSCPFCKKASYMWFDLHYQDMKGLLAALKKSQKDASILAEKISRSKGKGVLGMGCPQPKLEHDLTAQWRSLFYQMEEVFAQEGKELENRLLPLKDMREKCKMALEMVNPTPADN